MTELVQTGYNQSRRSFVRLATLSAIAAIPAVATLSRTGVARANPECVEILCACADCFGTCGGSFYVCKSICWDAHSGSCCGLYCPGGSAPGCGFAGTGCAFQSCGGDQC